MSSPSRSCPMASVESGITPKGTKSKGLFYAEYLKLDALLNSQTLLTAPDNIIHDEHLFIISHQAYELWFKQIIFELDSIRNLFTATTVDESQTLLIITRLGRTVMILKLLLDQFPILETMTPLDFMEFRGYLAPASGFQSLQFRLMENKFGVQQEDRVMYNQQCYQAVFTKQEENKQLQDSISEPSLLNLLQKWLERTPGLESNDYIFWTKYEQAVKTWLHEEFYVPAMNETDLEQKEEKMEAYKRQQMTFDSILNVEEYNKIKSRGERRFTHKAFQGAMMIQLYRNEPRFNQPFQVLTLLMDFDSLLTKWRYNHVMMVQRMIGSKIGTGGSSGYQYLRSTVSDRYKVFLDLFNLSTFLIPRAYLPRLTYRMKRRLSMMQVGIDEDEEEEEDE